MIIFLINLLPLVKLIVFIRILLTWFMPNPPQLIMPVVKRIDMILKPFKTLIPFGGHSYIDIGPMLFLLLIEAISHLLTSMYYRGFAF